MLFPLRAIALYIGLWTESSMRYIMSFFQNKKANSSRLWIYGEFRIVLNLSIAIARLILLLYWLVFESSIPG
jgi:hypothetical protein